ncbi:hypothetical protein HPP92_010723 [Vanilla planifolia]|uniref:BZIP domain-containing protein n=1 Tax=Vanilla planifolia TaxID=51239 RepID=A0A835R5P3_VANPL|nr:hypothetical protein HPP92_010723 [Vanilla planifolia]
MSFMGTGSDGKDANHQRAATAAPLARQSSIYSLTLDEFQSTMGGPGKDFGSMNMDEFLRNIWTAEESQAFAAAFGNADSGVGVAHSGLQRQGSLTLPRTLSVKTVDQVWRDLVLDSAGGASGSDFRQQQQQQRQPTLGEMTLEEFLVRAGVVREGINPSIPFVNNAAVTAGSSTNLSNGMYTASGSNNTRSALGFAQDSHPNVNILPTNVTGNSCPNLVLSSAGTTVYTPQLPLGSNVDLVSPQQIGVGGLGVVGNPPIISRLISGTVGFGGGVVNVTTSASPVSHISSDGIAKGNGDLSSMSPMASGFNGVLTGRKCSSAVEKVVERRQRRMIKNRESAARSRARKQAYTVELEAEVQKLKEQNKELQKKQEHILEIQKNQVLERMLNEQRGTKKLCLRRTQTGPW